MIERGVSDSTRWTGSVAGALLLHAGAVAVLLLDFGSREPASIAPPLAAMTVELALLPASPERQLTRMPTGPEQIESRVQPKPRLRAFDPPPQVKAHASPDALAIQPDEKPEADQVVSADLTTAAPASLATAADDTLQAPVQGVPSEQAAAVIQTWENRLLTHLERHKRYPGAAQRRRQEDVVYLRFTMDRNGKVLQWNIWRSGGYALLDAEVNALIQRASPLPPPPDEMTGSTVEMIVPVEFYLRRQLAQGRSR